MYNENQVNAIATELRNRFINNTAQSHEIVITLLAMEKSGRITPDHIKTILLKVFFGNKIGALKALADAKRIVSDTLLDQIIESVEGKKDNNEES